MSKVSGLLTGGYEPRTGLLQRPSSRPLQQIPGEGKVGRAISRGDPWARRHARGAPVSEAQLGPWLWARCPSTGHLGCTLALSPAKPSKSQNELQCLGDFKGGKSSGWRRRGRGEGTGGLSWVVKININFSQVHLPPGLPEMSRLASGSSLSPQSLEGLLEESFHINVIHRGLA